MFSSLIFSAIQLLIKNRQKAKIHKDNPYLFANINDVKRNFSYVYLNQVIAESARNCGAEVPEDLRSTKLRKQVATHGAMQGFDERQVGNLSEFSGHTDKIHRKSYRMLNIDRDMDTIKEINNAQGIDNTKKNRCFNG